MAERVQCEGCGESIHDRFAVCPLCGAARRARTPVGRTSLDDDGPAPAVGPRLPRWDTAPTRPEAAGLGPALRSLLLPAPHTRGWMRAVEIALTAIAAPLFGVAALAIGVFARRATRIDLGTWILGALFGAALVGVALAAPVGLDARLTAKAALVCLAAWVLRSVVRALSNLRAQGE